jgi:phosphate transport system permease protein
MSSVIAAPRLSAGSQDDRRSWRKAKSAGVSVLMVVSFLVVMIPLVLVVAYVVNRGMRVMSISFLTDDIPFSARHTGPGMGPAVVGTLVITGMAALLAVPLGILGGIYLSEYGGSSRPSRALRFLAEVMTGVPSIVMGLFIYTLIVLHTQQRNGFAGALALACLMLPVIIVTTEEMLRLVPAEQREASYALGTRKARTIIRVVLPAAAPGIISGALLAIARAAGETAPLLFTIGVVNASNWDLFSGSNTTLSAQIFVNAQSPFPGGQDRAWGAALTLIVIVFLFTVIARVLSAFYSRKAGHT